MAASGTAEIQQVGKTSKTNLMKGKEIASRKGETRPPLNFLSILHNADKTINTSCPDELCKQLYTGVFLKDKELKYFVDEKTNKNCFMLFAKKLDICWINDYWKWTTEEACGEVIAVAELKKVCWLDIRGKFDRTIDLSPGTMYEIVFVVRMRKIDDNEYYTHISNYTVTLVMILPHSRTQRNESLEGKPVEEWFEILVGEFIMSPENVGSVEFSMEEHGTDWKSGLIVQCAIIRPKSK